MRHFFFLLLLVIISEGKLYAQPVLTANPNNLQDFGTIISGNSSVSQSYQITGTGLTGDLIISATNYYEISSDNITFQPTLRFSAATVNTGTPINLYVRFSPTSEVTDKRLGVIKHSTTGRRDLDITVTGDEFGQATLPAKRVKSKAIILTSSFNLPIVRFNRLKTNGPNGQSGNAEFFNSVGAGLSFLFGKLEQIQDSENQLITSDFANTMGLSVGFLFAANVEDEDQSTNIFATTVALTILDFQVGLGWEHGDRGANTEKMFVTIAYGIPLTKISRKSGVVIRNWKDGAPKKKGENKVVTTKPIQSL